jgi:hypothetical protein
MDLFKCWLTGLKAIGNCKALHQAKSLKNFWTFFHYGADGKLVSKFRIELHNYYAAV